MSSRSRQFRAPIAALAASALVVLSPGIAVAADNDPAQDPVQNLVESVTEQLQPSDTGEGTSPAEGTAPLEEAAEDGVSADLATPSSDAPNPPASDDDSAGHESENPQAPDHAGAQNAEVDVAENDAVDIGQNNATVQDDDSTTADSTLLAIGGQEIEGAHADSEGKQQDSFEPLAPATDEVCGGSEGEICLRVLYADASATENGSTSHSESRSGLASANDVGGAVSADLATSHAESERDQRSGRTTANSQSSLANVCVTNPDDPTAGCAVGAGAVHSEGKADSGNSPGTASRDSYVGSLTLGGEEQGSIEDPTAIAIQPECADPSLACVFLNQGETYVGDGIAGHVQDALVATVLPGVLDVDLGLGHTETLVHNDGGEPASAGAGSGVSQVLGVSAFASGQPAAAADVLGAAAGVLPNTGGVWSGLLAIALLVIGAGAFFVAYSRRQVVA